MKEKNALLKMIAHCKGSPQEIILSSPICRQYQSKNASKKTLFHEQNMPESPQEQCPAHSNRDTSKDHHTNLIPITSIKHPTSSPVHYKNDSNITVERANSTKCQQNSKERETKKQNYHNHGTNNLTGDKEADKNRQLYQEGKILQLEQEQQQRTNTKQVNSKEKPLQDQLMTKQKKKEIIIGDSMIKKIVGYLPTN